MTDPSPNARIADDPAVGPGLASVDLSVLEYLGRMVTIHTDARHDRFANEQGTIHGGFPTELADATIGTACSTLVNPGESFTSINLSATFIRPFWEGALIAEAYPTQIGSTISHWYCEILCAEAPEDHHDGHEHDHGPSRRSSHRPLTHHRKHNGHPRV